MKNTKENLMNGQALLFVVVAMTIALAMGLNISSRTLSTVSRVTTTDTSARVKAAAEAGAETALSKTKTELDSLASAGTPFTVSVSNASAGDNISAKAEVTVQAKGYNTEFTGTTWIRGLNYKVERGTFVEFDVSNQKNNIVRLCYKPLSGGYNSAVYTVFYRLGDSPQVDNKYLITNSYNTTNSGNMTNEVNWFAVVGSTDPLYKSYSFCTVPSGPTSIKVPNGPVGVPEVLRAVSLYDDVIFGVVTTSATGLDNQLYYIKSVGKLVEDNQVTATSEVQVYKSAPFSPAPLDFAVYSQDSGWMR